MAYSIARHFGTISERFRDNFGTIKKPRTLWVLAASSGILFALSNLSLYLFMRAIRPWPLPDHGKRYVKANQE